MRHDRGRIEVVCGSMFSGKTEELIRRVRRAIIARQQVQVFKHRLDNRSGSLARVSSHDGQYVDALDVGAAREMLPRLQTGTTVVAIDEAQFFDAGVLVVIQQLAESGMRVIVAGLDMDFRGRPFGEIPALMAIAEEVTKLRAICTVCGEAASRTQRLVNGQAARSDDPLILVGAQERYEARCRRHHEVGAPGSARPAG